VIRTLGHARLKTGERLRIAAIQAPAGRYADAMRQFLQHKGQPWMLHVDLANQGLTDDLRTTYYVGFLGTELAGNVMIVDDGQMGILGHVFTPPHHRRKGVCRHLMLAAIESFLAAGGRVLTLGTGYDSPPYWIYSAFGFRSVEAGNGHMVFTRRPDELSRLFAPGAARVAEARWVHWPGISLLFMEPGGDMIRSFAHGVFGPDGFEGGFLEFQSRRERSGGQGKVLLGGRGAVVGVALLQRDARWPAPIYVFDLFLHPDFEACAAQLLEAVDLPASAKVQAYLDTPSDSRAAALHARGFRTEAVLAGQLVRGEGRRDVNVLCLAT